MMDNGVNFNAGSSAEEPRIEHTRELRGLELTMAQLGVVDLIIGKVRGPITISALQQSAFRLQRRHPALRARFVLPRGGDKRPVVEFCEPSARRVHVEQVKTGEGLPNPRAALWQRVAEREVNQPFSPSAGYMFRVTWVPEDEESGYLVLAAQHALVDGISLMRLLYDLISETAKLVGAPAQNRNDGFALEPLPPTAPLLEQCPTRLYERLATRLAFGALVRSQRSYESPFPIQSALPAGEPLQTHCRFALGQSDNYEAIVSACKARDTTVGGAFAAATQFASLGLIQRMTGNGSSRRVKFPMTMDFSMRRAIAGASREQDAVGLLMGACGIGVSVSDEISFWELARKLKKNSNSQLRLRQPLLFHQAMDQLWDLQHTLDSYGIDYAATGGIAESVNISNVGVYPYPARSGVLSLEQVFGANSCMKGGPMFIVWLRSIAGRFHYNATSAFPAAARQTGDLLLSALVSLLEGCHSPAYDTLTLRAYVKGAHPVTLQEISYESV